MSRFGFVGQTYQAASLSADAQLTMNWMPEKNESGSGKADIFFVPSPGLKVFSQLSDSPVRGIWWVNTPNKIARCFTVAGSSLFEVFADGTKTNLGAVVNDGKPASMASSSIQLMIASGGKGYCYTFSTGILTGPITNINGVVQVGYSDGFFVALIADSSQIFVSDPLDGLTWDPTSTAIVSVFPDDVVSMTVDHREVCLLGNKQSQCYYDSGNTFPYDVIPGGYAEQGSAATFGAAKADNTVFWIGQDERGSAMAFRAQGYTPQRITTHAVESAWTGYSTIADAEAYSFQIKGHTLIHWYFPTANKSWRFDISTGLWHEVGFWDQAHGVFSAHRSRCHAFVFGKHLVGDWNSGTIYEMAMPADDGTGAWNFTSDFGNPAHRIRRSPYVGTAGVWNYFKSLEIMAEPGLGPEISLKDGAGNPRDPQLWLRWSDDGGKTWSNGRTINCGQVGKYKTRMIARQLGSCWGSIGRVWEISTTDPIPWYLIDADLDADPAMRPIKRLPAELRERA